MSSPATPANERALTLMINGASARLGGGGTVLEMQVRALLAADPRHRIIVLVTSNLLDGVADRRLRVIRLPKLPVPLRMLSEQLLMPLLSWRHRADVNYCVGNFGLLLSRQPTVVLLQNLLQFTSSDASMQQALSTRRRLRDAVERWFARQTCRRANTIVGVSQTIVDHAVAQWPEARSRSVVLPPAVPNFPPAPAAQLPEYCLFVASDAPHKEWCSVARVFRAADCLPPLLIVGPSDREHPCELTVAQDLKQALARQRVVWAGAISDRARLGALFRGAALVLVHSRVESFGLTLREAIATNGRVVASDLPAHREAAAEAEVTFYEPGDLDEMAEAICTLLSRPVGEVRLNCVSQNDLGHGLASILVAARSAKRAQS